MNLPLPDNMVVSPFQDHGSEHRDPMPLDFLEVGKSVTRSFEEPIDSGNVLAMFVPGFAYEIEAKEQGRKYACPVSGCGYRFKRVYDLERHVDSAHC